MIDPPGSLTVTLLVWSYTKSVFMLLRSLRHTNRFQLCPGFERARPVPQA